MKLGWNGTIAEGNEAVISVYDHGFLYGIGLFETFRTYDGRPYLLDRHLERLQHGCRELGIRFVMDETQIAAWVREVLGANGMQDGYVRLTVSAGVGELGLPSGDYEQPNVLLLVKPLPPVSEETLLRGRELQLLKLRRNTPEGPIRFKSLHYMNNIMARRELLAMRGVQAGGTASVEGSPESVSVGNAGNVGKSGKAGKAGKAGNVGKAAPEGLMLSETGWLAEGIVSNLFFVRGSMIHTPSVETGILPGVTRGRVLELAAEQGYRTEEGLYGWADLLAADEVWLTNSIQELVPVTRLTDTEGRGSVVGDGTAGPAWRKLLAAYREDTLRLCGDT